MRIFPQNPVSVTALTIDRFLKNLGLKTGGLAGWGVKLRLMDRSFSMSKLQLHNVPCRGAPRFNIRILSSHDFSA